MKAVAISYSFAFLFSVAVSLRLRPKTTSFDSLKRIDYKIGTPRDTKMLSVKWNQKSRPTQENDGTVRLKKSKEDLSLEMKYCMPYPTIVQVPESENWGNLYLPSFVELHRCAGGCSLSPGIVHCAISTEEKITIAVKHGHSIKQVAMSNHTACHCACLPKKCHRKQRFDADLCECVCIYNGERECNEKTNKQWDRHSCQCVCSIKSLDCDFDKTWNNDSCTCESAVDSTVA